MSESVIIAIIGVGGTLLGTIVGWLLGKINWGKLNIKVDNFAFYPHYHEKHGEHVEQLCAIEECFTVTVFNSSSENKIFSNAEIIFMDKDKQIIQALKVKDRRTIETTHMLYRIDNVGVVNIPPKSGLDILGKIIVKDNFEKIIDAEKVFLCYFDKKFKKKKMRIKEINYKDIQLLRETPKPKYNVVLLNEEQDNGQVENGK